MKMHYAYPDFSDTQEVELWVTEPGERIDISDSAVVTDSKGNVTHRCLDQGTKVIRVMRPKK